VRVVDLSHQHERSLECPQRRFMLAQEAVCKRQPVKCDPLLVRFAQYLPERRCSLKTPDCLTASIEGVRCTSSLSLGYVSFGLHTLPIPISGSPDTRQLQAIPPRRSSLAKRRDLQPMRARHLCENRDPFATPLNVGTVDTMHRSTAGARDNQHDVNAALTHDHRCNLTCSEAHDELVMFPWCQRFADNLTSGSCKADHEGTRACHPARLNGPEGAGSSAAQHLR
jgi:hypothetical protein